MRKTKVGVVSLQNKAVQYQESKKAKGLSRCTECLYYYPYDFKFMAESYVCEFHWVILARMTFNEGCVHGVSWRRAETFAKDERLCGGRGCLRLIDEAMRLGHGLYKKNVPIVERTDREQEEAVLSRQGNFEKACYNPETGEWEGSWLKWYQILGKTFEGKLVCGV